MRFGTWINKSVFLLMAVALAACSQQEFGIQPESMTFGHKVVYNTELDVLLVIDTSSSMAKHQRSLADQMPKFVAALNKTGLDYQIAVTTMDMGSGGAKGKFVGSPAVLKARQSNVAQLLSQRVLAGEAGSSVERGLEAMKAALSSPNTNYDNAGFLRPNSLLVVLFLSNEEDESPSGDYIGFLNQLKPQFERGDRGWIAHFIGVLPHETSCRTSEWNYSDPGLKYMQLADASGGRSESVCTSDLRMAVDKIQARIIEIVTEYSLGDRKAVKESIRVYVNGRLLNEDVDNGWTYNEDNNSIIFHGNGVPAPGSTIKVDFDPEGIK